MQSVTLLPQNRWLHECVENQETQNDPHNTRPSRGPPTVSPQAEGCPRPNTRAFKNECRRKQISTVENRLTLWMERMDWMDSPDGKAGKLNLSKPSLQSGERGGWQCPALMANPPPRVLFEIAGFLASIQFARCENKSHEPAWQFHPPQSRSSGCISSRPVCHAPQLSSITGTRAHWER